MSLKCAVILALVLVVYTIERAEAQEMFPGAPADFNQTWTNLMTFINPAIEAFRKAMPAWPPALGEVPAPAVPNA